jgi:uncharacterized caspase-like protein
MRGIVSRCLAMLALAGLCFAATPAAAQSEKRIALVIGNGAYRQGALATAANDAGLIAQTLQAAGFDVVGARDLDGDTLRHALHDFVQKAAASGPDTVAFVYLSGYALQVSGDNYFLPVDANIARDSDIATEGLRIGDYLHQLATLQLRVGIFVVDAARANPFTLEGEPLAGGLALVEPEPNMLVAFNTAPGTVGPDEPGPYGAYAQALAEMIRTGGLSLPDVFDHVRLRVNDLTQGGLVPWNAQRIQTNFMFFERAPDAPQAAPPAEIAQARTRQIRDFPPPDAYAAALERDTLPAYEEFLAAFPNDPMAARVRAIVAARREAITWRRTFGADTPNAYWSYLRRYPHGPHAWDARRRLAVLAAALEPPPAFAAYDYDVPPPPPDEIAYVDRPYVAFDDPAYGFAPPPPAPVYFLPPPEPEFVVLPPPPPPVEVFVLPVPAFVAMPRYVRPPRYVAPPPNNILFANIHNRQVIDTVINRPAAPTAPGAGFVRPGGGARVAPAVAAVGPALPPSVQHRAALIQQQGPATGARPTGPNPQANLPINQMRPLPGVSGQPHPVGPITTAPTTRPTNQPTTLSNTQPTTVPGNARPTGPITNVAPSTATQGPPHGRAAPIAALPTQTPSVAPPPPAMHHPGPPPAQERTPPPKLPQISNRPPPHTAPLIVNHPPPPPVVNRAPPPPVVNHAPPPAAIVNRAPPPVVNRPPPPPAVINRAPPPAAVMNRPPPPPPPPVVNRAPPPAAAAAAKKCVVENGKQVCR